MCGAHRWGSPRPPDPSIPLRPGYNRKDLQIVRARKKAAFKEMQRREERADAAAEKARLVAEEAALDDLPRWVEHGPPDVRLVHILALADGPMTLQEMASAAL